MRVCETSGSRAVAAAASLTRGAVELCADASVCGRQSELARLAAYCAVLCCTYVLVRRMRLMQAYSTRRTKWGHTALVVHTFGSTSRVRAAPCPGHQVLASSVRQQLQREEGWTSGQQQAARQGTRISLSARKHAEHRRSYTRHTDTHTHAHTHTHTHTHAAAAAAAAATTAASTHSSSVHTRHTVAELFVGRNASPSLTRSSQL